MGELPPPEDLLALQWERTISSEGFTDDPEPPEHLSQGYLCAVLRDLGRAGAESATLQSLPLEEAARRYPQLSHLSSFFGGLGQEDVHSSSSSTAAVATEVDATAASTSLT